MSVNPVELRTLVCQEIDAQFGSHSSSPSCLTAKHCATAAFQPFMKHKKLTEREIDQILTSFKGSISEIKIDRKDQAKGGPYLLPPAYQSTLDAIERIRSTYLPRPTATGEALKVELKRAIEAQFRAAYTGSNSYKTIERVIDRLCPNGPIDKEKTIQAIRDELRVLNQASKAQPRTAPWLDDRPYQEALKGLAQTAPVDPYEREEKGSADPGSGSEAARREWQACLDTWTSGGRQRARDLNIRIFQETLAEIERMDKINRADFDLMIREAYRNEAPLEVESGKRGRFSTEYEFLGLSTFDAAEKYKEENALALDMANKNDVGGGVREGASAQEEDCCRRSTLYSALDSFSDGKGRYPKPISPGGIYVPHVQVFRKGAGEGFAYHSPFKCAVYASAAYNCNQRHGAGYDKPADQAEYINGTKQKMRDFFRTAARHDHETVILSAFGCGAFSNDPELISQLYVEVLNEVEFKGTFKRIVFSILDMGGVKNLPVFQKTFENAKQVLAEKPVAKAPRRAEQSCLQRFAAFCRFN